ncbi:MAG: hypothetical protein AB3N14_19315 [Flavobacteriaceae bacterium]
MKTPAFLLAAFLFSTTFVDAQIADDRSRFILKQQILESQEAKEWQEAMIAYQRNSILLCELKKNQTFIFTAHGPLPKTYGTKRILELFRRMRLANELKENVERKENRLRKNYPEIAFFEGEEIFPEIYHPIRIAREVLLKHILALNKV